MTLLFDQNISPKIVRHLSAYFPEAKQVRQVGLQDASDSAIFEFAKRNNFAILTVDSDFEDLSVVRGMPPKIIWLKTGNLTTKSVATLLIEQAKLIQQFLEPLQSQNEILEIIAF